MDTPEKELLTPEVKDDDFESFYATIYDEFGEKPVDEDAELKALLSDEPKKTGADRNAYADKLKKAAPVKKDNSIRNLTILIIIELLGIAGVAAWWILRLL